MESWHLRYQRWRFWHQYNKTKTVQQLNQLLTQQFGETTTVKFWADLARHHYLFYQVETQQVLKPPKNSNQPSMAPLDEVKTQLKTMITSQLERNLKYE